LTTVRLAQLDSSNLGDSVRLIGRLKDAGEHLVFAHRLRGELGIYATGTEKKQFFYTDGVTDVNTVECHCKVIGEEISRVSVIRHNPANPSRRHNHNVWPRGAKIPLSLFLPRQVDIGPFRKEQVAIFLLETAHDC
jgi:hypothetical protein